MQPFVIPVSGLTQGSTRFDWRADGAFFGSFEHSEILSARLDVGVEAVKTGRDTLVNGTIEGTVTLVCDRCLEELVLPVQTVFLLRVVTDDVRIQEEADGRETVLLPEGADELDLSQVVYDYVNIALPMRRVHPDGACNPQVMKYLGERNETAAEGSEDSPFAALKSLLNDSNNK